MIRVRRSRCQSRIENELRLEKATTVYKYAVVALIPNLKGNLWDGQEKAPGTCEARQIGTRQAHEVTIKHYFGYLSETRLGLCLIL